MNKGLDHTHIWHHKHFFKEIKGGILMEDVVDYKIPLGWLGQLAHFIFEKID